MPATATKIEVVTFYQASFSCRFEGWDWHQHIVRLFAKSVEQARAIATIEIEKLTQEEWAADLTKKNALPESLNIERLQAVKLPDGRIYLLDIRFPNPPHYFSSQPFPIAQRPWQPRSCKHTMIMELPVNSGFVLSHTIQTEHSIVLWDGQGAPPTTEQGTLTVLQVSENHFYVLTVFNNGQPMTIADDDPREWEKQKQQAQKICICPDDF